MTLHNYWLLIIWPILFGVVHLLFIPQREELVLGRREVRWNRISAFILVLPLIIWAGWRTSNFGDTGQYISTFNEMPTGLAQMGGYVASRSKGPGFAAFEYLIKTFLSHSVVVFFLIVAAIQLLCIMAIYRKYSRNFWFSMFLFIASTDYILWMHNGMRQFLAVAIVFTTLPLIVRKQYLQAIIVVLIASLLHVSALIFLPFIFIVNGRAWNLRTLLFLIGVVLAVIFADRITNILSAAMQDTAYEGDIEFLQKDDGTNVIRVLFYSVPTIMALVFRQRIYASGDLFINACANLSIVASGFYIFSIFTSGILMGAIPIYFSLANYILIPWILTEVFNKESAWLLEWIFALVYVAFFYYQMGVTWGLL